MEHKAVAETDSLELHYRRRRASIIHKEFKLDQQHGVTVTSQGGSQCFNDVWVLVSDLSGFTKTTKKYGITHFTAIILRQYQIFSRLINYFDPIAFSHEADNWTVLFGSGERAMEAALAMKISLARQNKIQVENSFPEYSVKFGGCGISKGDVWTRVGHSEFYGNSITRAFRIGEDLADKSVGLSEEAHTELSKNNPMAKWSYHEDEALKWFELVEWNKPIHMASTFQLPEVTADISDERFLMFTALFSGSRAGRDDQKKKIEKRYMDEVSVCIMFSLCWGDLFARESAPYVLNIRSHVNRNIADITVHNHGMWNATTDGGFCVFKAHETSRNVYNALRAVFEIKEGVSRFAKKKKVILKTSGFGIDLGQLLVIPYSRVCYGDALNCASKLGEDVLGDGEIGMTSICFDALKAYGMPTGEWEERTYEVSGVMLECKVLKDSIETVE